MTAPFDITPAARIARLDEALQREGQNVQLRKTNSAVGQITVRANVRTYGAKEVVGIITAGDREVTISPTGLDTFGAPPVNGYVVIDSVPCRIISVKPLHPGGVAVRYDLQVRG